MLFEKKLPPVIYGILCLDFVSAAFTFIVPLLSAIFLDTNYLNKQEVGFIVAFIFLCSSLLQGWSGKKIDEKKYFKVVFFASVFFVLGCLLFLIPESFWTWSTSIEFNNNSNVINMLETYKIVLASFFIILGLRTVSVLTRSYCFSLLEKVQRDYLIHLFYLTANSGMCCAGLIAYFFLKNYKNLLFALDIGTTLLAVSLILFLIIRNPIDEKKTLLDHKKATKNLNKRKFIWHFIKQQSKVFLV